MMTVAPKVVLFANTDWYLFNYRLAFARRLRAEGFEVLLMSPPGPYGSQLVDEGFRWEAVPMDRRSLNPLRELRLLVALTTRFRQERPDIVHGFTIKCAVYGGIAGRLAGVRGRVGAVAGLGHVFSSDGWPARMLRPLVRMLLRMAFGGPDTRLILQNPDDALLFRNTRLIQPEKIRLIPSSGVDCQRFRPVMDDKPVDHLEPIRVVLATRLLWAKGVQEYVDASRILHAEGRSVRFFLAGMPDPGNPGSVPREMVEAWAAEGLVEWLGHLDDVAELLSGVDVMVLASYYREGVPRTLIEGAASGLALITTDMPGCREVVTDGVDGLLVPTRDARALARAVARLQDDSGLARQLGNAARKKALAEFDERLVFDRTLSVYAELGARPETLRSGDGANHHEETPT